MLINVSQRIVQKKSLHPTEFLRVQRLGLLKEEKTETLVYVSLKKYIETKYCSISYQNPMHLKGGTKTNLKRKFSSLV
jgi:hypothetical protein